MATADPFILLDDARPAHGGGARLFEQPVEVFRALRPGEVEPTLAAAQSAQAARGGTLAGYLAYEAGLALEPKLHPLADARTGAAGPLVWLGLFDTEQRIAADAVGDWLAQRARTAHSHRQLVTAVERRDASALRRVRWMLEEYRVSLWAQQLGTAHPVSDQRIRKVLG